MNSGAVVYRIVREEKPPKTYLVPHKHDYYQSILGLSGSALVVIDDHEYYYLKKDSLLLIPPGATHTTVTKEGFISIDIKFSCPFLQMEFPLETILIDSNYSIKDMVYDIVNEASREMAFSREIINSEMAVLLYRICRHKLVQKNTALENRPRFPSGSWNSFPSNIENNPVRDALLYIESNIHDKITVANLAEISGYEKNYFSRVFERVMNEIPSTYIKKRKISTAKNMLITSTDSITDIAQKLGFENIQHFSKVFRATEGVSPTDYRKRITAVNGINLSEEVDLPKYGRHAYSIKKWSDNKDPVIKDIFDKI